MVSDALLVAVVAVGGLAGALLTGTALAAYLRRRSRSYLLVGLALAALLARAAVAGATMLGVVGAGYYARTVEARGARPVDGEEFDSTEFDPGDDGREVQS